MSLLRYTHLFYNGLILYKPHVYVYQMGKVGSSTIRDALVRSGQWTVSHFHSLIPWRKIRIDKLQDPELKSLVKQEKLHMQTSFRNYNIKRKIKYLLSEQTYQRYLLYRLRQRKDTKIIIPIRDPFSVNISMFFQCYFQYAGRDFDPAKDNYDFAKELFLDRYKVSWPITWFQKELYYNTGIDIYDYSFDKIAGFRTVEYKYLSVLIFKSELPLTMQEAIISGFLGHDVTLNISNSSSKKDYSDTYKKFKDGNLFSYKERKLIENSKYFKHFYS